MGPLPIGRGDDRVGGAVDDGDIVAVAVRHVDSVRVGVHVHANGADPDAHSGDDRVGGAIDDEDVVAAPVRHVDKVRVWVDGYAHGVSPDRYVATTMLLGPSMTET